MYGPNGCDYCGGEPFHRITCPMLRWLVLGGFVAALISIGLAFLLGRFGVSGFGGVDWPVAAFMLVLATAGMIVYEHQYRRRSRDSPD